MDFRTIFRTAFCTVTGLGISGLEPFEFAASDSEHTSGLSWFIMLEGVVYLQPAGHRFIFRKQSLKRDSSEINNATTAFAHPTS
jgi:hypothetical protein